MEQSFTELLPFELNNYIFVKEIGTGTYSKCYLVKCQRYDVFYCAKVTPLDPAMVDEDGLLRDCELAALMSLDHPNIIQLFQYFTAYNHVFLILELCDQGTLLDMITNNQLQKMSIRGIMKALASALAYCHDQGIAHRDVKPANIFMSNYGRPKLGDFGLSAFMSQSQLVKDVCGSLSFLSPEILSGEPFCPFKADVWALGVTLFQMATGELPKQPLRIPLGLPARLRDLLAKMLDPDPEKRPSMQDVLQDPFLTHDDASDMKRLRMLGRRPQSLGIGKAILHSASGFHLDSVRKSDSSLGCAKSFMRSQIQVSQSRRNIVIPRLMRTSSGTSDSFL